MTLSDGDTLGEDNVSSFLTFAPGSRLCLLADLESRQIPASTRSQEIIFSQLLLPLVDQRYQCLRVSGRQFDQVFLHSHGMI